MKLVAFTGLSTGDELFVNPKLIALVIPKEKKGTNIHFVTGYMIQVEEDIQTVVDKLELD